MHEAVQQVILVDQLEGFSHGPGDDALLILVKGSWGHTTEPPATMPSAGQDSGPRGPCRQLEADADSSRGPDGWGA